MRAGFAVAITGPRCCRLFHTERSLAGRGAQFPHRHRMNRRVRDCGNVLRGDAAVDERTVVAVKIEIVDDRRVIVNTRHLGRRAAVAERVRVAEMPRRHEGEAIHRQAEIKTHAHAAATG